MRLPGTGLGVARLVPLSMVKVDMRRLLAMSAQRSQSRAAHGSPTCTQPSPAEGRDPSRRLMGCDFPWKTNAKERLMFERKLLVAAGTVALFAAPALAAQPADRIPMRQRPPTRHPGGLRQLRRRRRCRDAGDPGDPATAGGPGGQGRCGGGHRYARASDRRDNQGQEERRGEEAAISCLTGESVAGPCAAPPNSSQRSQPRFRASRDSM